MRLFTLHSIRHPNRPCRGLVVSAKLAPHCAMHHPPCIPGRETRSLAQLLRQTPTAPPSSKAAPSSRTRSPVAGTNLHRETTKIPSSTDMTRPSTP